MRSINKGKVNYTQGTPFWHSKESAPKAKSNAKEFDKRWDDTFKKKKEPKK